MAIQNSWNQNCYNLNGQETNRIGGTKKASWIGWQQLSKAEFGKLNLWVGTDIVVWGDSKEQQTLHSVGWIKNVCVCADSSPNEHTECQKIAFFSHFTLLFVCPFLTSRLFSSTFLSYSAWGHFPFYFFFFLFRFLHIFRQPFPSINSSKFTIVFVEISNVSYHISVGCFCVCTTCSIIIIINVVSEYPYSSRGSLWYR